MPNPGMKDRLKLVTENLLKEAGPLAPMLRGYCQALLSRLSEDDLQQYLARLKEILEYVENGDKAE